MAGIKYLALATTLLLTGCYTTVTVYPDINSPVVREGYYPDPVHFPGYYCGKVAKPQYSYPIDPYHRGRGQVITGWDTHYDCW